MDALAETWYHSGQKPEDLYKGTTKDVVKELKKWIEARMAKNQATLDLLWSVFDTHDLLYNLGEHWGSLQDSRVDPIKAKYVRNVERIKEFKKDRERMTRRALFLISTMSHQGIKWLEMASKSQWSEVDAQVCAFLETQEDTFNGEKQLKILELEKDFEEWHQERARRDIAGALAADDQDSTADVRPTPTIISRSQSSGGDTSTYYGFLDPVDLVGLAPPPSLRSKYTPSRSCSTSSLSSIEAETSETEETPEAIALRINSTSTVEQKPKVEKKSKTKIRNAQRRKAKALAKGTAKAQSVTGDEESGLQNLTIDD